jgi:hypothetical protein
MEAWRKRVMQHTAPVIHIDENGDVHDEDT